MLSIKRLKNEYKKMIKQSHQETRYLCNMNEENILVWQVKMFGPKNTPYEMGIFDLKMEFPISYPFSPPVIRFLTKVFL